MKYNSNLLIKALEDKAIKNDGNSGCFINVMNNDEVNSVIKEQNALNRQYHNYSQITFIEYLDYGNGFKGFDKRQWAYIVTTSDPNRFQIRKDLIDEWKASNAKDAVIVVSPVNDTVYFLNMADFFGFKPKVSWSYKWNEEGNLVCEFDHWTASYTFKDNAPEEIHPYAPKLDNAWNYLGHVTYSKYRSKRMVLVGKYDANGKLVKYHKMKSLVMAYEMLHLENNGVIRSFRRNLTKNLSMFVMSSDGIKYYITFDDITNTVPQYWNYEPVTVETEDVIDEDGYVSTEVTDVIVNVNTTKDMTDKEHAAVINEALSKVDTKPKRVIIRGEVNTSTPELSLEDLAEILEQANKLHKEK